jgi:hypothetical protein
MVEIQALNNAPHRVDQHKSKDEHRMAAKKSSDLNPSKASLKSKVEKTRVPAKGKAYTLDLRVHSPASLGYYGIDGIDTAPALVSLAKVKGLDVIAVTDFHSGVFVDRVVEAAKNSPVTVIPGVDLRCVLGCCDDLILTCLFPESVSGDQINEFLRELAIPKTAGGDMNYITRVPFESDLACVEPL